MARKAKKAVVDLRLLDNWNTLNASLLRLTEEQVGALLAHEQAHKGRLTFTLRLHSRINRLRRERERRGLASSAGKNVAFLFGEKT